MVSNDPNGINNVNARLDALEEKMEYVLSLITKPAVLQIPEVTEDQAENIREQLNAVIIQTERKDSPEGDTGWGGRSAAQVAAAEKAQTQIAQPVPGTFKPSVVGYTAEDFRADFPGVNPGEVLASFLSHHRSKGDHSKNWMEKFFSYANTAVKMEKERKAQSRTSERETDSMGLPLDRAARIRAKRAEMENHQQRMAFENEERKDTE